MKGFAISLVTAALVLGAIWIMNEANAPRGTPPGETVSGEVPRALDEESPTSRDRLLHTTAAQAGVTPIRGVWGVIMERGYAKGVATVTALADGTATLSVGAGAANGKAYPPAHAAAVTLCEQAADSVAATTSTQEFPKPAAGRVRFYVLTKDGVRTAETDSVLAARDGGAGIRVRDTALASMMTAGDAVLSALREATERGILR